MSDRDVQYIADDVATIRALLAEIRDALLPAEPPAVKWCEWREYRHFMDSIIIYVIGCGDGTTCFTSPRDICPGCGLPVRIKPADAEGTP